MQVITLAKTIVYCLIMMVMVNVPVYGAAENLLSNSDFEKVAAESNLPEMWQAEYWQAGSTIEVSSKVRQGKYSLMINSPQPNDARIVQTVKVKPNTYYRLSGYVWAENITPGKVGANLCVMGDFNHSPSINETTSDWTYTELNFKTAATQKELSMGVRLGMWGNDVTGTAYFDEVRLVELAEKPVDFQQLIDKNAPAADASASSAGNLPSVWLFLVLAAGIATFIIIKKKRQQ